eukprot:CAMPEP_0204605284 /NCGR_PEP_ID=MMETSP0661-20131031/58386_1 /ASSEMBLY_ACC=CAM_ASM_000606 /TAXON_ID=109239 /ORGANISM="Alexandrium margalefi, Strain AMGDE01CS-322" /LENGTH=85 /DNA_ID=CAMNT_0051616509 /DNA_START=1 /DNA_END=254 /DNA_ORIENTATION=-
MPVASLSQHVPLCFSSTITARSAQSSIASLASRSVHPAFRISRAVRSQTLQAEVSVIMHIEACRIWVIIAAALIAALLLAASPVV